MLKTIKIENFRGFESFELQNLGRLNLLVGTNNSGKNSILEAIRLLCSRNNLEPLREMMISRGECFWDENRKYKELDICHLFYNHEITINSRFLVLGVHKDSQEKLIGYMGFRKGKQPSYHLADMEVLNSTPEKEQFNQGQDFLIDASRMNLNELGFILKWTYAEEPNTWRFPLSGNGGLSDYYIRAIKNSGIQKKSETKTQFITSSALSSAKMIDLFDQIVLTPEEDLVLQALQTIEPRIIRIASVSSEREISSEAREGFMVRFSDSKQRIPIGSMGDGIWRILGLALATVSASNGVLLVDEIDTGLHFTAMSDMWKLVWETAKRLNVQVFATTHSSDCWMSLADIASREDTAEDGITIQRIEKGKDTGVVFNREQILTAAKWDIEVR